MHQSCNRNAASATQTNGLHWYSKCSSAASGAKATPQHRQHRNTNLNTSILLLACVLARWMLPLKKKKACWMLPLSYPYDPIQSCVKSSEVTDAGTAPCAVTRGWWCAVLGQVHPNWKENFPSYWKQVKRMDLWSGMSFWTKIHRIIWSKNHSFTSIFPYLIGWQSSYLLLKKNPLIPRPCSSLSLT
jgi:hypothetical protein